MSADLLVDWTARLPQGTHTGLEPTEDSSNAVPRIVAACTSLLGFTWVLVVFGIITERVGLQIRTWRHKHARLVLKGHILVLGWTDKTLFLIGELAQMMADGPKGGGTLVILGDVR